MQPCHCFSAVARIFSLGNTTCKSSFPQSWKEKPWGLSLMSGRSPNMVVLNLHDYEWKANQVCRQLRIWRPASPRSFLFFFFFQLTDRTWWRLFGPLPQRSYLVPKLSIREQIMYPDINCNHFEYKWHCILGWWFYVLVCLTFYLEKKWLTFWRVNVEQRQLRPDGSGGTDCGGV